MQSLPHTYRCSATSTQADFVTINADGVPAITSAPPPEFGGPEGKWSPETLFIAAVADCFVLTFKALATHSKFEWLDLTCAVEGTLDKSSEGMMFTAIHLKPVLTLAAGSDEAKAQRLLERSEGQCLVSNSLKSEISMASAIEFQD